MKMGSPVSGAEHSQGSSHMKASKPAPAFTVHATRTSTAAQPEQHTKRNTEIFFGGLTPDTQEHDLNQLCSRFGTIMESRVVRDGRTGESNGYGFVRFHDPRAAKKALANLTEVEIRGKQVSVALSTDNRTLFVGNLPKAVSPATIREYLEPLLSSIIKIVVPPDASNPERNRGFAFVKFDQHLSAARAYGIISRRDFGIGPDHHHVTVRWALPGADRGPEELAHVKSIFVSNIPRTARTSKSVLHTLFSQFGEISRIVLAKDIAGSTQDNYAFVNFASPLAARRAIKEFDGQLIQGYELSVSLANPVSSSEEVSPMDKLQYLAPKARHQLLREHESIQHGDTTDNGITTGNGNSDVLATQKNPPMGALPFPPQQGYHPRQAVLSGPPPPSQNGILPLPIQQMPGFGPPPLDRGLVAHLQQQHQQHATMTTRAGKSNPKESKGQSKPCRKAATTALSNKTQKGSNDKKKPSDSGGKKSSNNTKVGGKTQQGNHQRGGRSRSNGRGKGVPTHRSVPQQPQRYYDQADPPQVPLGWVAIPTPSPASVMNGKTPGTLLNEYSVRKQAAVEYQLVGESGRAHARMFTMLVSIAGVPIARGVGPSKKGARHAAALLALQHLMGSDPTYFLHQGQAQSPNPPVKQSTLRTPSQTSNISQVSSHQWLTPGQTAIPTHTSPGSAAVNVGSAPDTTQLPPSDLSPGPINPAEPLPPAIVIPQPLQHPQPQYHHLEQQQQQQYVVRDAVPLSIGNGPPPATGRSRAVSHHQMHVSSTSGASASATTPRVAQQYTWAGGHAAATPTAPGHHQSGWAVGPPPGYVTSGASAAPVPVRPGTPGRDRATSAGPRYVPSQFG